MDFDYKICLILSALLFHNCLGQDAVGFQLKISPEQPQQQFELGQNRLLTCLASATAENQKPVLYWEVNGVKIESTTDRVRVELRADDSLMVRVDMVQDGDEGSYKCVATLGSQTDSRTIIIVVIQALKVHSPGEQYGIYGTDGEVNCLATSKPLPTITWKFKNGTRIISSLKYVIQTDKLTIKTLDDADTMEYVCDIVVSDLGTSVVFPVKYTVVRIPKIDMIPIITPNNPKVGDSNVKITCRATGFPQPTYEFKRGDNILPESAVDEVNGIYTIVKLSREDEATYTCVASNIGGKDEKSNFLDVKIPPTIEDIPDVTNAVEGGVVRLSCKSQGDPAPTVIWQKEGLSPYTDGVRKDGPEIIVIDGKDREDAEIKTSERVINFDPITPQDVGTYICTALNVVGNATATVKLEVKYKPHFDTYFKDTEFYGWKNHATNVTCLASANEVATIQWNEIIDNRTSRIDSGGPYTVTVLQQWANSYLSSRSLMVYVADDVSPVFKDYICEAINSMGQASHKVTLKRALPPNQPMVKTYNILSTKITLEVLAPGNTGGLPVTGYHYTYFAQSDSSNPKTGDIDSTQASTILELKDLTPNTNYVIKVSARSEIGLGSEMSVMEQTKDVSEPVKLDITSPPEGSEPTSYMLQWNNPDDGGSPIIDMIVKYRRVIVSGTSPSKWTVTGDVDKTYTVQPIGIPVGNSYTIKNLDRGTFYDIRMTAVNKEGESPEAFIIVKTSQGAGAGSGVEGSSLTVNATGTLLLLVLACLTALW